MFLGGTQEGSSENGACVCYFERVPRRVYLGFLDQKLSFYSQFYYILNDFDLLLFQKGYDGRMALADQWGGYRVYYLGNLVFLWPPFTQKGGW